MAGRAAWSGPRDLLDIVVDRIDQRASVAKRPACDKVAAEPIKVDQFSLDSRSSSFFRSLARPHFVPSSCGRLVLCFGHSTIETRRRREANYRFQVAQNRRELLRVDNRESEVQADDESDGKEGTGPHDGRRTKRQQDPPSFVHCASHFGGRGLADGWSRGSRMRCRLKDPHNSEQKTPELTRRNIVQRALAGFPHYDRQATTARATS